MMKVVIDISEEDYNNIEPFLNGETIKGGFNLFKVLEIIKNGKPLPKGHKRLIEDDFDVGPVISEDGCRVSYRYVTEEELDNAPTIIEADKEG